MSRILEGGVSVVVNSPDPTAGSTSNMPPKRLTYREIADDIEARIRRGEYRPGSPLPSYSQVAEIYSVGVTTAQTAMRLLRDRGLSESVPGVGTFVVDELPG